MFEVSKSTHTCMFYFSTTFVTYVYIPYLFNNNYYIPIDFFAFQIISIECNGIRKFIMTFF